MRPEDRDLAYLWDMRKAALDVMEFTKGIKYARFCSDKMLRYAVERRIPLSFKIDTTTMVGTIAVPIPEGIQFCTAMIEHYIDNYRQPQ